MGESYKASSFFFGVGGLGSARIGKPSEAVLYDIGGLGWARIGRRGGLLLGGVGPASGECSLQVPYGIYVAPQASRSSVCFP